MESSKFSGVCTIVAAVILGASICLHALTHRYHFEQSNPPGVKYVFDTWTGELELLD